MSNAICNAPECNQPKAARGMCMKHYHRARAGKPLNPPPKVEREHCTIQGCTKPTRSRYATVCAMHYHRQYRHGNAAMTANESDVTASLGRRYRTKYEPRHPLASKHGVVYVHRKVLYDAIGEGPHPCHWCGTATQWTTKGMPGELQPDHLNGDGSDNRIENLVPSCRRCNTVRGSQARAEALRQAGWWSNHDTIERLSNHGRVPRIEPAF